MENPPASPDNSASLGALLGAALGDPSNVPSVGTPPPAPPTPIELDLTPDGLFVRTASGGTSPAPGCARPAIGREPSLARAVLSPSTLRACFTAMGPTPGGATLMTRPELPFELFFSVLEHAPAPTTLSLTAE